MRACRKGFTLIELLIVILVMGVLAAIAIAKFVDIKERAYIASMKADLRNFALYEQNYLMDSQGSYFAGSGAAQGFVPTVGVTVTATRSGATSELERDCHPQQDGEDLRDRDGWPVDLGHRLSLRSDL